MSNDGTRERLLRSAEYLFAEHGYASTSIRQIVQHAGVNIAAIHYHFGNKRSLLLSVIQYRFEPLEASRLSMLASARVHGLTLESIVRAFIEPVFDICRDDPVNCHFLRLMGQQFANISEDDQKTAYEQFMKVTRDAFLDAFHEIAPETERQELYWQFHIMIALLTNLSSNQNRLVMISEGELNNVTSKETREKIIYYTCRAISMQYESALI